MSNTTLLMPQKIREECIKLLKKRTREYTEEHLIAPDKKQITTWAREKLAKEYWPDAKYLASAFRKSLPIVSHRISDGKKTSKGKKGLGRTFAAPTWVSADLGDSCKPNAIIITEQNFTFFLKASYNQVPPSRLFSSSWKKLRRLFHSSTNHVRTEIYQENKKQKMVLNKTGN